MCHLSSFSDGTYIFVYLHFVELWIFLRYNIEKATLGAVFLFRLAIDGFFAFQI